MNQRVVNPNEGIYPATPDYIHALEFTGATRQLYVSGTMGLAPDGSAPESLDAQLDLVWSNIKAILAAAGMSVDNVVRVTSYLRSAEYVQANQDARVAALNGRPVPTTSILAETLTPDWKIEIEVIAAA